MPASASATPCIAIRRAAVIVVQNCNNDSNDTAGAGSQKAVAVSATMTLTA